MAVIVSENGSLFTIHTVNSTYQMKADKYGVLLHLYYGRRSEGSMEYLLTYADRGYASQLYDCGDDRTYSLDVLPQEFPVSGTGDMRSTALIVEYGNGIEGYDPGRHRRTQGPAGSIRRTESGSDTGNPSERHSGSCGSDASVRGDPGT